MGRPRFWLIINDSGIDYDFLRGFDPEVKDGAWLYQKVLGVHDPIKHTITIDKPDGQGTYTASELHFELLSTPLDHFIQVTNVCYYWMGPAPQRRPIVRMGKKTLSARRVLWELCKGPLTKSQVIVDTCINPMCMRLAHLQIKTRGQLVKDSR